MGDEFKKAFDAWYSQEDIRGMMEACGPVLALESAAQWGSQHNCKMCRTTVEVAKANIQRLQAERDKYKAALEKINNRAWAHSNPDSIVICAREALKGNE